MNRTAVMATAALATLSLGACGVESGGGSASADSAENYPTKPVTMVVAWEAGGGTDIMARALVQNAEEHLGQPIRVVNKPGGSGAVGWGEIAHSTKPDGYTLSIVSPEIGFLREQGLYDFGLEHFDPITLVNQDPAALTVRADAPWDTVEEFLAAAKKKPGGIKIGNSGPGLLWDLATTAIEEEAGVKFTHVPYDGSADAVQALLGGQLQAVTFSIGEVSAQVEAGELKVLGLMAEERWPNLPDVPTFADQGYDLSMSTFRGVAGPAGMDPAVVEKLDEAFAEMAKDPEYVKVMEGNNLGVRVMRTEEFVSFFEGRAGEYETLLSASGN